MALDVSGAEDIQKRLDSAFGERFNKTVLQAVTAKTLDIHSWLVVNTPVDSGNLRNRWNFDVRRNFDGAFIYAEISNNAVYAPPVIFGSEKGQKPWPGPGPKTVLFGGRVYSDQSVGNLLERALDINNYDEISELAADTMIGIIGGK